LSNAYKYTNEFGKVSVNVSEGKTENGNPKIIIKVSDTGIGIPEEHLPNIFDSYYRIGQQQATGSGIGLALTKSLVEIHKGRIWVESQPGKGTDFIVELPLDKNLFSSHQICEIPQQYIKTPKESFGIDHQQTEMKVNDFNARDNDQQKILLIIEDNTDIRVYIKDSFTDEFNVFEAPDGEKGLELAFKHIPDIIITDIMMPGIDGLEVCRRLKENLKTCHIPVVMLTARNTLYQKQEGYETGADSYVTKPFSTVLLKSRVQNLMRSRKMLTEHISRTILLQPDELHINLKDEKFISDAIAIIENHLIDENFSVDFLSSELGISHPVLYRKVKALTGFSIAEFIRSIRLKNAAQLLRSKQYTISEVAFKVGFSDMKHFRQCFRDQYKVLPSDYQRQETAESSE
jgi:DNA-binding response OmpR family regulator